MNGKKSRISRSLEASLSFSAMISTLDLSIPGGSPLQFSSVLISGPAASIQTLEAPTKAPAISTDPVEQSMSGLPIYFEENLGQFNSKVRYFARSSVGANRQFELLVFVTRITGTQFAICRIHSAQEVV